MKIPHILFLAMILQPYLASAAVDNTDTAIDWSKYQKEIEVRDAKNQIARFSITVSTSLLDNENVFGQVKNTPSSEDITLAHRYRKMTIPTIDAKFLSSYANDTNGDLYLYGETQIKIEEDSINPGIPRLILDFTPRMHLSNLGHAPERGGMAPSIQFSYEPLNESATAMLQSLKFYYEHTGHQPILGQPSGAKITGTLLGLGVQQFLKTNQTAFYLRAVSVDAEAQMIFIYAKMGFEAGLINLTDPQAKVHGELGLQYRFNCGLKFRVSGEVIESQIYHTVLGRTSEQEALHGFQKNKENPVKSQLLHQERIKTELNFEF